ncbi:hypothetical protein P2318_32310 [Myxococcaceae bacterium GXIMD 01537]
MAPRIHLPASVTLLLALTAPLALAEPPDPDTVASIRILNGIDTRAVIFNPLTAGRVANAELTRQPLKSDTFQEEGPLKEALRHASGRTVLRYIVECALEPTQPKVTWYVPTLGTTQEAAGKAGLCPEWAYQGIGKSERCQELVSACVLARNNATGTQVHIAMRGEDVARPRLFNPDLLPHVWTPLLLPTPELSTESGLAPEFGWRAERIGTCLPRKEVTLGAGAYPAACGTGMLGTISGDRVLRVCGYPSGCLGAEKLADTDGSPCSIAPLVTFTCPDSGQYSVMSAPYFRASTQTSWVTPATTGAGALSYPYGSYAAFASHTFREGAFYGNIFDPSALAADVTVSANGGLVIDAKGLTKGAPMYQRMYACHGRAWTSGTAALARRLCANDAEGDLYACAAEATGPCEAGSTDPRPRRCDEDDGSLVRGDGDFEKCRDPEGRTYTSPITTFLRTPCSTLSKEQQQVCTETCTRVCELTHCSTVCTQKCRMKTDSECL